MKAAAPVAVFPNMTIGAAAITTFTARDAGFAARGAAWLSRRSRSMRPGSRTSCVSQITALAGTSGRPAWGLVLDHVLVLARILVLGRIQAVVQTRVPAQIPDAVPCLEAAA